MKKILFLICVCFVVFNLFATAEKRKTPKGVTGKSGNLYKEGKVFREIKTGFEGEKELPEGWAASNESGFSFTRVSDVVHSGETSGLLTVKEGKKNYGWSSISYEIPQINIKKGEELTWELSFFVKSQLGTCPDNKNSFVYAGVDYLNSKNSRLSFDQGRFTEGITDWKKVTMKGIVNNKAKKLAVKIMVHGPGKAWVDDIHFVLKKGKAKEPINHPLNHRKPGDIFRREKKTYLNEFIKVADDNWTFIGSKSERAFVPWGTTLAFPYCGINQKYKNSCAWDDEVYDIKHLEKAFKAMQELNVNLVKIPLTIKTFLKGVTCMDDYRINPVAIKRFEEVLALAKKYKIRILVQAPNHWGGGGFGPWGEHKIGEKINSLDIYLRFWEEFVPKYKNETIIFGWALCVEKEVYHPGEEKRILDQQLKNGSIDKATCEKFKSYYDQDFVGFLKKKYKSLKNLNLAWKTKMKAWEEAIPAENKIDCKSMRNYDTQLYRQYVGVRWVKLQAEAIRKNDPNHLIGCGIVQRNNPLVRQKHYSAVADSPATYGALEVRKIAKYLDFIDPHFYPVTFNDPKKEMEWLKAYLRYCYVGKPLIFGEFGHGNPDIMAKWNKLNVESSIGLVSGWMPWQLHNTKGMGDHVTKVSGLVEDDFKTLTEWGKLFKTLKRDLMLEGRKGCGSCEETFNNHVVYFSELEEMVELGGANLKFVLKY